MPESQLVGTSMTATGRIKTDLEAVVGVSHSAISTARTTSTTTVTPICREREATISRRVLTRGNVVGPRALVEAEIEVEAAKVVREVQVVRVVEVVEIEDHLGTKAWMITDPGTLMARMITKLVGRWLWIID